MILVTGGTGFIGRHVVRALVEGGHDVRVLARPTSVTAGLPAEADLAVGDVRDRESLKAAVAGCDLVYHLAGDYRGTPAELWSTHAEGTANLLDAVDPAARVVLLSSTSVYGWGRAWPAEDDTPAKPASAYGVAKLAAEQQVLARRGGRGVVARTTIVYGPGDASGMLTRAERLLRRGWRWFPGDGRNRLHLTHVDDVVRGLLLIGEAGTGVYLLAGPAPTTVGDLLGAVAAGAGAPRPRFVGAASSAARAAAVLSRVTGRAPIDRHGVEVLTEDRWFVPRRAKEELGWTPRTETLDGVRRLLEIEPAAVPVPDWRRYLDDHDEGVGSVYERFVLDAVIERAMARTGASSVLHAPIFGLTGVAGRDAIMRARAGASVGLLDVDAGRLDSIVELWRDAGEKPDATYLAPWPDTSAWSETVPAQSWDLVVSFAALWWCRRPAEVLAAQARWATKGVLVCLPNPNVFHRVRARLWHREMFDHLNLAPLDPAFIEAAAAEAGLRVLDTGLFDMPPIPDTAASIKDLVPGLGRRWAGDAADRWRWEFVPWFRGDDPELPERLKPYGVLERHLPGVIARRWAHHRYWLLVPATTSR